jgi:hypothetical protein
MIGLQIAFARLGVSGFDSLLDFPDQAGFTPRDYLAMDRPMQIARAGARMIDPATMADLLRDRLLIWPGPPPLDLALHPSVLTELCRAADADTVIVDSLKDAALKLTEDETGAAYNRARPMAIQSGVQVIELHHIRKLTGGQKSQQPTLDSIYGSTWLTSGAGSVVLLNGSPGNPIIDFYHLKQPISEVGPFRILHHHDTGRSSIFHSVDLVELARGQYGVSAAEAASALFNTAKPSDGDKERARRRLHGLETQGRLWVYDKGDRTRPTRWKAITPGGSTQGSTGSTQQGGPRFPPSLKRGNVPPMDFWCCIRVISGAGESRS